MGKDKQNRPKRVTTAINVFYIALTLFFLNSMITMNSYNEVWALNYAMHIWKFLIIFGFMLFLVYMISEGQEWAKNMLALASVVIIPLSFMALPKFWHVNLIGAFIGVIVAAAHVFALILLFQKSAKKWFKSHEKKEFKPRWEAIGAFIFVGIILSVIFPPLYYTPDTTYPEFDSEIEKKEYYAQEFLEEDGYEVLYLAYSTYSTEMAIQHGFTTDTNCYDSDYSLDAKYDSIGTDICWSRYHSANVKMKSLGNYNTQVWDALMVMSNEDMYLYRIEILEPTQTCLYWVYGDTWNRYNGVDVLNDLSEENIAKGRALHQEVDAEIEAYKTCE